MASSSLSNMYDDSTYSDITEAEDRAEREDDHYEHPKD